jgi:all-trans-retinol dehydrogenase (NAD+)
MRGGVVTQMRGSRVLITGAASGIGRLMALEAAGRGAQVMAWDIDATGLASLAGGSMRCQVVDVTDRQAVYAAASDVEETLGGVDVLVLNAGVVCGRPLLEIPDGVVRTVMDVNVLALFWCTKAFLPGMVQRGRGHLAVIGSVVSAVPAAGASAYVASKHAAYGFTETVRLELRTQAPGVRTTFVMPYLINTGMFEGAGETRLYPLLRMLEPEPVAVRVIDGIERDKARLVLPAWGPALIFPLRMLPPRASDWLQDMLGFLTPMQSVHGRALARRPRSPQADT